MSDWNAAVSAALAVVANKHVTMNARAFTRDMMRKR
jgi:hypothetical protein